MKCYTIEEGILGRDDIDIRFVEYGHSEAVHTHGDFLCVELEDEETILKIDKLFMDVIMKGLIKRNGIRN